MIVALVAYMIFALSPLYAQTAGKEAVSQFDLIPDQYLTAARAKRVLFMNRSVGVNLDNAINCFTAQSYGKAQNVCRREMVQIGGVWQYIQHSDADWSTLDPYIKFTPSPTIYNRSNWSYFIFADTWETMVQDFIEGLHNGGIPAQTKTGSPVTVIVDNYDILSFQFSYLNVEVGSTISQFFTVRPGQFDDAWDLEREIDDHLTPRGAKFIYWTSSLARSIGTAEAEQFNNSVRFWAALHNRPLFDFAGVGQHNPDGSSCYDNRDGVAFSFGAQQENYPDDGLNISAVCPNKTPEANGGHLVTAHGTVSVAKAFWVMIAKLAGWNP